MLAASLVLGGISSIIYLAWHYWHYWQFTRKRNRYVPDRLTRGRVLRADGLKVERIR